MTREETLARAKAVHVEIRVLRQTTSEASKELKPLVTALHRVHHMTLQEIGEELGVSGPRVHEIINGKKTAARAKTEPASTVAPPAPPSELGSRGPQSMRHPMGHRPRHNGKGGEHAGFQREPRRGGGQDHPRLLGGHRVSDGGGQRVGNSEVGRRLRAA